MTTTAQVAPAERRPPISQPSPLGVWLRRRVGGARGALGLLIMLAVWQIFASAGIVDVIFSSSPVRVVEALVDLFSTGEILGPIEETAAVLLLSLGISLAVGIPLGLLLGRSRVLYDLTAAIVDMLYAVPHVLFLPIIIFWFGIDSTSRAVLVIWAAIMPLIINVRAGGRNLNRDYTRVAKVFCAPRTTTFWRVALPATLPYVLAGIRLAIGRALVGAIVAEFFLGAEGLGHYVQTQTANLNMDNAMAAIVIIAVAAMVLNGLVGLLERRFSHWAGV